MTSGMAHLRHGPRMPGVAGGVPHAAGGHKRTKRNTCFEQLNIKEASYITACSMGRACSASLVPHVLAATLQRLCVLSAGARLV